MTTPIAARFRSGRGDHRAVPGGWETMWPAFAQAYDELVVPAPLADESELRSELLFCLLGGHGITFEMSHSALHAVSQVDVFAPGHDPDRLQDERCLATAGMSRYARTAPRAATASPAARRN